MEKEKDTLSAQLDRIERNTLLSAKSVLTVDDVVLLTGLTKRTVYRLTSTHRLPYYKPNGKAIFFNRSEVEKWLFSNRISSIDEIMHNAIKDVVLNRKRVK